MSDVPVLGYTFVGRGPAQKRLLEWLQARMDCDVDTAVAQRSPAGTWAYKVHAHGHAEACAALLREQPWVERVVARPHHLYVRLTAEAMVEWVCEGYAAGDPVAGCEGAGRSVLVRAVDVDAVSPRPLRLFRETAVARSVAALLRSRGFEVALELLPPGEKDWSVEPGSVTHTVVVGGGVPMPSDIERGDHVVHLPVGEVDVRHGPLRARHGGSVSADDLVADIVRRLPADDQIALGDNASATTYGEAVLALLLLATPRARRIQLDDAAVEREMETFGCAETILRAGNPLPGGSGEQRAELTRELAAEADLLATMTGRGAVTLEPALAARSLRSLAERAADIHNGNPLAGPLWPATRAAITSSVTTLGGLGVPARPGQAVILHISSENLAATE